MCVSGDREVDKQVQSSPGAHLHPRYSAQDGSGSGETARGSSDSGLYVLHLRLLLWPPSGDPQASSYGLPTPTGLILVNEPYYNEAGFDSDRGLQEGYENSRCYNEMALIRVVQSMTQLVRRPPEVFEAGDPAALPHWWLAAGEPHRVLAGDPRPAGEGPGAAQWNPQGQQLPRAAGRGRAL